MVFPRTPPYRPFAEPIDDFGADEAFLQNVVAPAPVAAPAPAPAPSATPAPAPFNPADFDWSKGSQIVGDYVYSPVFQQSGSGETLEIGPLINILRTSASGKPGDIGENLDPATGQVLNRFRTEGESKGFLGDLWSNLSSIAADVGPVVQAVPFVGQAVQAINAINAARSGSVLPLVASAAGYGGYSDIANAARAAEAIRKDDYLGAVIPALQAAGISDVGGFSTKDIGKAVNVARAIEQENPLALAGAASAYLPGPSMPGLFVDENIQEGFFEPGGPGYIEPTTAPASYFPEFDQPLLTEDPTDWAALYAQPTTDPVTGQTIVGADQAGYPVQDFGVEPQSDINEVYNRIANDMGGFASTWQTVGSDRVMVQDDGSAIGINTETNESYALTPEETERMVSAGLLNTADSGYEAAIRGESSAGASTSSASGSATSSGSATASSAKPKAPAFDPNLLFALGLAMTPQQKAEEDYQLAQILGVESPFGRIV